jgi:hypothetical protein
VGVHIHYESDILIPRYITDTSANTATKVHFQSLRINRTNFADVSRREG